MTVRKVRGRPFRVLLGEIDQADGDGALAELLRESNDTCPPAAFAVVSARARERVGARRHEKALRLAGLGLHLDLPYTPTAAELTGEDEERNVLDVLRRRRLWRYEVSSADSYVSRFEHEAERLLGVRHVHATVSGTVALQIAMMALGIGPGDEIVIPAVGWVGCADAAILCGAVPVPAQVDATLGLDPADAERKITPRTKAIMAVSLLGNPCDLAALRELADRHGLALLEDGCQACGVSHGGRRLGGHGDAAVFSTNFMKFVAAGDGGFIATDRDDVYAFAVRFTGGKAFPARKRDLGLSAPVLPFSTLRMTELTGAVALAQIQRLDRLLAGLRRARDEIFARVGEGRGFRVVQGNDPAGSAGWSTLLLFPDAERCQAFAAAVRAQGVRHVTTSQEKFAGAEIYHCWPAMAGEQPIPQAGGHWATEYPAMTGRRSVDARSSPWTHPLYDGTASYPEGFMDESLALIARLAVIQTNPRLEPEHCATIAAAIRTADERTARP